MNPEDIKLDFKRLFEESKKRLEEIEQFGLDCIFIEDPVSLPEVGMEVYLKSLFA